MVPHMESGAVISSRQAMLGAPNNKRPLHFPFKECLQQGQSSRVWREVNGRGTFYPMGPGLAQWVLAAVIYIKTVIMELPKS